MQSIINFFQFSSKKNAKFNDNLKIDLEKTEQSSLSTEPSPVHNKKLNLERIQIQQNYISSGIEELIIYLDGDIIYKDVLNFNEIAIIKILLSLNKNIILEFAHQLIENNPFQDNKAILKLSLWKVIQFQFNKLIKSQYQFDGIEQMNGIIKDFVNAYKSKQKKKFELEDMGNFLDWKKIYFLFQKITSYLKTYSTQSLVRKINCEEITQDINRILAEAKKKGELDIDIKQIHKKNYIRDNAFYKLAVSKAIGNNQNIRFKKIIINQLEQQYDLNKFNILHLIVNSQKAQFILENVIKINLFNELKDLEENAQFLFQFHEDQLLSVGWDTYDFISTGPENQTNEAINKFLSKKQNTNILNIEFK